MLLSVFFSWFSKHLEVRSRTWRLFIIGNIWALALTRKDPIIWLLIIVLIHLIYQLNPSTWSLVVSCCTMLTLLINRGCKGGRTSFTSHLHPFFGCWLRGLEIWLIVVRLHITHGTWHIWEWVCLEKALWCHSTHKWLILSGLFHSHGYAISVGRILKIPLWGLIHLISMTLPYCISHILGPTQINVVLVILVLVQFLPIIRLSCPSIVHSYLTTRPWKLADVVAVCCVLHPL